MTADSAGDDQDTIDGKRTEFAVIAATFIWFAGNNFITPFLPLYIQQLGHLSIPETALWTGVTLALTPLVSAILAPAWGMLADRYGRKLLLQRSLLGFAICLGLMGLAQAPWQLLIIRAFMGVFGGFSAGAAALITLSGRPGRVTRSIGRVQAARVLGMALGPIPGGLLADAYGYRVACLVSVAGGVIAFLIVTILAKDRPGTMTRSSDKPRSNLKSVRLIFAGGFIGIFIAVFVTRLVERTFDPILPLLVGHVGASPLGLASTTAVIVSVGLVTSAVASTVTGRFIQFDRGNRWLTLFLLAGTIPFVLTFLATEWWQLLILRGMVGIVLGVSITLAFSTIAQITPAAARGLTLSTLGSGISFGSSVGYLLAGGLASLSLQTVFIFSAGLMLVSAIAVFAFRRGVQPEAVHVD